MTRIETYLPALEAVIFAGGEPIHTDKLVEAMQLDRDFVLELCGELAKKLDRADSGIRLVKLDGCYQLCTKSDYADYVRRAFEIRRNTPLSQAALEVLSVVAYNQPVTKAFVEQVRGVDCSGVIGSLSEKGLIEEKGRLDLPGRPLLYGTTSVFLRCFGLSGLDELPPLPETPEAQTAENPVTQMIIDRENEPRKAEELADIEKLAEEIDIDSVISGVSDANTMQE